MIFFMTVCLISIPLCTAVLAQEELGEPSTFYTFMDALVFRPVGLIIIPVGFAAFLISAPFSAIDGNVSKSFEKLVVSPTNYTFYRPLGDI